MIISWTRTPARGCRRRRKTTRDERRGTRDREGAREKRRWLEVEKRRRREERRVEQREPEVVAEEESGGAEEQRFQSLDVRWQETSWGGEGRRGASRVAKGKVGPEGGGLGERRREANGGKPGKGRAPEEAAPSLERDESEQRNAVCRRRHHRRHRRRHHRRDRCRHRREDNVGGTNGHARVCRDTTATFWPPPETKWLPRLLTSPRDGDKTFSLLASFSSQTPDQRSNSFQSYFSFAESFNEPRYLFHDAPIGLPDPSHVRRDPIVFPSMARCVSSNAEPSFRVSPLPPTATLGIARYFGKTFLAPSRDRLGESRRNAVGSTARDSTVNGRARFGNRAGSYLSSQLRIRCARHRCDYFAARSVNTPATDSRSIRGVNLSKALASARHSEYHLNALSVAAYTRLRSRVNDGRGIGRRWRWRGPRCRADFVARRKRRSTLDRLLLADEQRDRRLQDGSTYEPEKAWYFSTGRGGRRFLVGRRSALLRAEVRETSLSETLIGERREPRGRSDHRSFRFASLGCF